MASRENCLHVPDLAPRRRPQRQAFAQPGFGRVFTIALLLACCCRGVAAQETQASGAVLTAKAMEIQQTRYELRPGEPARISATGDTLDFLLKAKSRRIQIGGAPAAGLVVGPNRTGDQILLAASLRTKPGEYAVTISATSAAGEER